MPVEVHPIWDTDASRVGKFLHTALDSTVSAEVWTRSLRVPWEVDSPNAGFMLLDDGVVVGTLVAFYSERTIDGTRERFCNLGPWAVLERYRLQSLRLLSAVLGQSHYHFTDLTPSPTVAALNAQLGFEFMDTTTVRIPAIPWPARRTAVISSDTTVLARTLTGSELQIYKDHAHATAVRHLVVIGSTDWCYVMFRTDRRHRLLCASIIHVSDVELFRAMAPAVGRHLLIRHGAVAMQIETRIVDYRPPLSVALPSPPPKMFRSPYLTPAQIDDLYSERVCLPW